MAANQAFKQASAPMAVRIVTANVQSFPEDAITPEQALADLTANAAIGDIVLLQEIVARYRPLARRAFPAPEWEVYYGGQRANDDPIAYRRDLFTRVSAQVVLVHRAIAKRHPARYLTVVGLRHQATGQVLHVTNVHLVSGAFNDRPFADKAERVEEWQQGMALHREIVEKLVQSGDPVVGGGDYNRRLASAKPLGDDVLGRRVQYAVDQGSIDLIWLVDGDETRWHIDDTDLHPGRDHRHAERNSDHGARVAAVTLRPRRPATSEDPVTQTHPRPSRPTPEVDRYGTLLFGDVSPKKVDNWTAAALREAERRLGYRLTLVQGSYNAGGVRQSAGTHDGGGVVDLLPWDWQHKVKVLRAIGFAAWYRPTVPGLWGAHIHAVLIDHGRLAPAARQQVVAYRAGRDGLKGNRPDTFWRPSPIPVFTWPPPARDLDEPAPSRTDAADRPGGPAYPTHPGLDGVDTSHHQAGKPDLARARAAGLKFWYLKATEGDRYVDPTYAGRARQARRAGIPVGAYHFARPDAGDAVAEARHFLEAADVREGDMLPMLDLESTEGLSARELTAWTGAWVRTVTRQLARRGLVAKPLIYTPFDLEDGFGCLCWVARYSNAPVAPRIPRPWQRAAIWQHSNGVYGPVKDVPGFGHVDVNAVHPDVPLAALRVRRAAPPPGRDRDSRPPHGTTAGAGGTGVGTGSGATSGTTAPPDPAPAPGASDLAQVRHALDQAVRGIQAALDRLPER